MEPNKTEEKSKKSKNLTKTRINVYKCKVKHYIRNLSNMSSYEKMTGGISK